MAAMEEKDLCTHSKLKQEEPFRKKKTKKQKRQKEKNLNITGGAPYITFIFEQTLFCSIKPPILNNGNRFVSRGVLNKVSYGEAPP